MCKWSLCREFSGEIDLWRIFEDPIFDGFSLLIHQKVCMAINAERAVNFQSLSKL